MFSVYLSVSLSVFEISLSFSFRFSLSSSLMLSLKFSVLFVLPSAAKETRPEVSEGGPAITNLIQGVAREEADRHRQIEVSMDLPL